MCILSRKLCGTRCVKDNLLVPTNHIKFSFILLVRAFATFRFDQTSPPVTHHSNVPKRFCAAITATHVANNTIRFAGAWFAARGPFYRRLTAAPSSRRRPSFFESRAKSISRSRVGETDGRVFAQRGPLSRAVFRNVCSRDARVFASARRVPSSVEGRANRLKTISTNILRVRRERTGGGGGEREGPCVTKIHCRDASDSRLIPCRLVPSLP